MKADSNANETYVKGDTLYLSGTKQYNSKDVEAIILCIAGRLHNSHKYGDVVDTVNNIHILDM